MAFFALKGGLGQCARQGCVEHQTQLTNTAAALALPHLKYSRIFT